MLDLHSLRPKSQQATRRKQKKKKSETSRKKGTLQRIIISELCSEDNRIEIDITAGIFLSKTFFVTFNSLTKLNLIIHQPPWSTYSINPSYCLHDYTCRHSPRSYTEGKKKKNSLPCLVRLQSLLGEPRILDLDLMVRDCLSQSCFCPQ